MEFKEINCKSFKMDTSLLAGLPPPDGYENIAEFYGLEPEKTYYYEIYGIKEGLKGGKFTTPPDSKKGGYRFVVYGDTRTQHKKHQFVVNAIIEFQPDFIVHTGDLVGVGGVLEDWQIFFDIEKFLIKDSPLYPTFGNHENILGEGYYKGYFYLPEGIDGELSYSFNYGNTAFVVMNSETDYLSEKYLNWLEGELKKIKDFKFKFISLHRPIYTFSKHKPLKG